MALHTSAWGRPIQGVSQQPPKIRIEGQCSVQENAISSAVSGLYKRPGTTLIKKLCEQTFHENTRFHYYNRGSSEKYLIAIEPNQNPRVFDMEGDELTVEMEVGPSYLNTSNPKRDLRLSTLSDFTFIANSQVTPQESSDTTEGLAPEIILYLQFADYGNFYEVYLDETRVAYYHTPDGDKAVHADFVDTNRIVKILLEGSDANPDHGGAGGIGLENVEGYDVRARGNAIILTRTDGGTLGSVRTTDGSDGKDFIAIKHRVSSVDQLPPLANPGYKIEVAGSGTSDIFWLEAEEAEGSAIRWKETTAPGISKGFDHSSMPHALVRDRFEGGKAVFVFQEVDWSERAVGDDNTNPMPSFIQDGEPIRSIGTFQNRLYFTAGESVIYSQSNFFFNFFKRTVREDLDDAPVDVYADTNQVNVLYNSAVLDGDVVFFSENGQFLQSGEQPMTQDNATLRFASSFENNIQAPPVAAGDVIFFAFEYGRYTGIREFYTDSFTDTKRARPVTDHVDQYILGEARQLATSTNRNQLLVLADDPEVVYTYTWIWEGQDRVQSSWSLWRFPGAFVRYVSYDKEVIYFILERDGATYLEFFETGDHDDPGMNFPVRLDNRFETEAVASGSGWEFEAPYVDDRLVFVRGAGTLDAGVTLAATEISPGKYFTEEPISDSLDPVSIIGGIPYDLIYEPTMPFIRDQNGRVIDTDRLIINDVNINYDKTGLFTVFVENDWGVVREYQFNGRKIGDIANVVGFSPLEPGQFSFPMRQDSDKATFQIKSSSHLPFQLRDLEWRGRFRQRGRRV